MATEAEIRAIFDRHGVPYGYHAQPGVVEDPNARISRLAREGRPLADIERSVAGLARTMNSSVAPARRDAFAQTQALLNQYGLGELADWAWQQIVTGASPNEIRQSLYQQEAFQRRFQAIFVAEQNGWGALTPEDVVNYENTVRGIARQVGLDWMFQKPEDFVPLIANGLDAQEVQTRIQEGFTRVARAAPEVRVWMADYFGADSDSALAALYLNPARSLPELERMTRTAEIGGTGAQYGLRVGLTRAGRLADLGVTRDQMAGAGRQLRELAPAFSETISESDDLSAEDAGLSAVFEGDQRVRRRIATRAAATRGGGGAAASNRGLIGLGSAD